MSIQSEITRISNNVQNTIDVIEQTGVSVPAGANSDNLPSLAQALANEKQDKLTGTQGQVVGFDESGKAVAQDAPSGLPDGGTPGQMLWQGESGPEWGDKPVMYVNITGSEGNYTADKTFAEIESAYQAGHAIYACCSTVENITQIVPFCGYVNVSGGAFLFGIYDSGSQLAIMVSSNDTVAMNTMPLSADAVTFNPGSTDLTSDNVQGALEEINAKIPEQSASGGVKATTATLSASSWWGGIPGGPVTPPIEGEPGYQVVQVPGVLADSTAQAVDISPTTQEDAEYWSGYGVWCTAQGAGTLTFTCKSAPGGMNPGETPGHSIDLNIKLTPLSGT